MQIRYKYSPLNSHFHAELKKTGPQSVQSETCLFDYQADATRFFLRIADEIAEITSPIMRTVTNMTSP